MRTLFLLTICFVFLFSSTINAQEFLFVPDSIEGQGLADELAVFQGPITNQWDQENRILWEKTDSLPQGWTSEICQVALNCWPIWITSDTLVLPAEGQDSIQVKFHTSETEGSGSVRLVFTALADPEIQHEWTFTLHSGETSVQRKENSNEPETSLRFIDDPRINTSHNLLAFYLPGSSVVKIKVYDINGKEINVLREGVFNQGINSIHQVPNLPVGAYIYQIDAGQFGTIAKRIVLLD